jgi:hypothetical protein
MRLPIEVLNDSEYVEIPDSIEVNVNDYKTHEYKEENGKRYLLLQLITGKKYVPLFGEAMVEVTFNKRYFHPDCIKNGGKGGGK